MISHPLKPIYDRNSRILILGSFPSVKSREQMFYYGHLQNRFWKVIASIYDCPVPNNIDQKRKMLLDKGIAIWDVIASCDINGSSDSSIRNVITNDLSVILKEAKIENIYLNGNKTFELYQKYLYPISMVEGIKLPSTSPANAAYSLEKLIEEWKIIKR